MSEPVLFSVAPDPQGGFLVVDALKRLHRAADDASLGALIARLTTDPELPRLRVEKRNDVVGIFAGLARRFSPRHAELIDAAEPMAHHVTSLVKIAPVGPFRRRRRTAPVEGGS